MNLSHVQVFSKFYRTVLASLTRNIMLGDAIGCESRQMLFIYFYTQRYRHLP